MLTAEQSMLLAKWRQAKVDATQAVETERALRAQVTEMLFPNPVKGTQRYDLGEGWKVKLVHSMTPTLGDKDLIGDGQKVPVIDQVDTVLNEIEKCGNVGPVFAERLVKWKPELSMTEYEKLDTAYEDQKRIKALIDSILTLKPAAPQLEIEAPKAK